MAVAVNSPVNNRTFKCIVTSRILNFEYTGKIFLQYNIKDFNCFFEDNVL